MAAVAGGGAGGGLVLVAAVAGIIVCLRRRRRDRIDPMEFDEDMVEQAHRKSYFPTGREETAEVFYRDDD